MTIPLLYPFIPFYTPLYPAGARGVPVSRREDIVKKLSLLPSTRRIFWQTIDANRDE